MLLYHNKIKIILDTNVFISAFVFKGIAWQVYKYCVETNDIVVSEWLLNETFEKLITKFEFPLAIANELLNTLLHTTILLKPDNELPTICRDKDDNNVLQLAVFSDADYIITGDKDLLVLMSFHNTKIISPREFYNEFIESV